MSNGVILNGDCLTELKNLPDNTFDSLVTDPPAGISFMGKTWDDDKGASNTHPTVKSSKLMEYLITLITPPSGLVLDCFAGSGSTGVAAVKAGFDFLGIEKELEYSTIAENRIASALGKDAA